MADGSRPRRARPPRSERREEILGAATRVFGSKGYHAGSLVDVAEQVGITHAGVLHHFGSKDKLLWAVLEYRDRLDVEHLEGQHIPGGLDLFRHLVTTAGMNAERRGIVQAYSVLTGESVTDGHPAAAWVTERFAVLRREIADALIEVAAEREVSIGHDRALRVASTVIGVMDGLQVQWLLDPDAVDLATETAFAIEAILAAALAGSEAPRLD
ncbi:TetR/AcrR family transcriptional regulator [Isoptericola sp. NEAU-Y5]|uniref:TetR/AcrR family transcriptional regulator n=1 Tax=Isoptericola luteus TaxID=2879484 RepID=A0ABS7ZAU2_9MICO|nr:TetR/AcrR family transcriptional regulator [Isoptericola sp. NEAU-Y5]MCA5892169.1 TetR/AcrR family transcriptional regulator [Isoptericola sp. NEAU-Y5]